MSDPHFPVLLLFARSYQQMMKQIHRLCQRAQQTKAATEGAVKLPLSVKQIEFLLINQQLVIFSALLYTTYTVPSLPIKGSFNAPKKIVIITMGRP